jgi:hypothetical protein
MVQLVTRKGEYQYLYPTVMDNVNSIARIILI